MKSASAQALCLALLLALAPAGAVRADPASSAAPQVSRADKKLSPHLAALSDIKKIPLPPLPPESRIGAAPATAPQLAPQESQAALPEAAEFSAQAPTAPIPAGAPEAAPAAAPSGAADSPLAPNAAAPVGETGAAIPDAAPLPPLNAAIKAALEARGEKDRIDRVSASRRREQDAVAAFYAARDFAPLWSHEGNPIAEVRPALQRLQLAAEDGLSVRPPRFAATGSDEEIAGADIALSAAIVSYARQASGARVDPRQISALIGLRPEVADPSVALATVSTAGQNAGAALLAFNPPQPAYQALRAKLNETRRAAAPVARAAAIPTGPTLKVGMRDPRVPLIRSRLSLDGREGEPENLVYDTQVASAVADFQKANGLPGSGQLNARTIALLSGGDQSRVEAEILANMERWRWMPRDMGESRIEVNIPDYEVSVIENGAVISQNRVVVGKEDTPTPVFSNTMQFLIVNPYWTVPQSIIRKEMMPKIAADPNYLHRMGYEAVWKNGKLGVRQPPGERNALGRIKFMFPNDYAVYLHDTPSRALFEQHKRAFSHGCVRVDDPFRFAQSVLGKGWSEERVQKLIGGKERYVHLAKPLPIHLEYFTAKVDPYGQLQLSEDIYGFSRKVRAALGLEG
ncbi:ErfK/YbiS/YcfS/YnhG family protein [Methylocella silvestris BL2]|uniref:ErfK/YbiS/YcfS/YnhG family protein n=1 Tax=Methylocella silvestris (strain DSM 15510 / CIP 108128 / LMG 27833 / NCIMB 13906 / BL2) TaxID=395965 RepID=B8EQ13_METSB|nr:L,D-transpeptidase family protein [Methylocella silvestris]ACK51503.1 ErfK/YbiS/YcfS/YnhG family protein [Methylocella silvestris BL2]